ncbi:MAG: queuosine salvage family protein [Actinomycetota bacterium]|nr:queuosine salvage family protein [Actinomycetota bacterium]
MALVDEIRSACRFVAERARWVRIASDELIAEYAQTLSAPAASVGPDPEIAVLEGSPEVRAAFALTLEAINFGSGYWPEIRRRPGRSGFTTMALGLRERFDAEGPWSAAQLEAIDAAAVGQALGQDPGHRLMDLYAEALRDLGRRVTAEHGGRFAAVAEAADGSAVALVERLARWDCFADVSTYEGRSIPFYKRAQLGCTDLADAGVVRLGDLDRLTLFADNLVPHVLRVDGLLAYDEELLARIESGVLIEHGSAEEVEIRACAVEAVERIARTRPELTPHRLDHALWNRGREPAYKARPRHRARSTAY